MFVRSPFMPRASGVTVQDTRATPPASRKRSRDQRSISSLAGHRVKLWRLLGMATFIALASIAAFIALAVTVSPPASAQTQRWERRGLDGREVRVLVALPGAARMAALTAGQADPAPLWLYDERGWYQPAVSLPDFILSLALMPNGGVMFGTGRSIADQPGIFLLTEDAPQPRQVYDAQAIGYLTVAPRTDRTEVYAASAPWADRDAASELLRREAGSGTWRSLLTGTLVCGALPSYFKQVVVTPSNPDVLLALEWCFAPATKQSQLWRSDDHGQTWRVLPRAQSSIALIGTVAVDPYDPNVLYAAGVAGWPGGTVRGIERSLDGGESWTLLGADVDGLASIRTLAIDPRYPSRLLVGTETSGVWISEDQGETWQPLPGLEGIRVWRLLIDPPTGLLYAATSDGVWRLALP